MSDLLIGERLRMLERPIRGIASLQSEKAGNDISGVGQDKKLSFSEILAKSLEEVNALGVKADREINLSISGNSPNPHSALLALQEAEISFNLMTTIKDRLEQAYQQLVRMQL